MFGIWFFLKNKVLSNPIYYTTLKSFWQINYKLDIWLLGLLSNTHTTHFLLKKGYFNAYLLLRKS